MTGLREKTWKKENLKHRLFEVVKMHTPPYRAENTGVPITPGFIVFLSIFQAFRKLSILLHKFLVFHFQPLFKNRLRLISGAGGSEVSFHFIAGQ